MELGSTIIVAFLIAWVIQFTMTFVQMRRFNKRLGELRKCGTTAVGIAGSMYKRRAYGVLVIDENEKIIHAEQFSGWTVFAELRPVKELEGLYIKDLTDKLSELTISKKICSAFINAVEQVEKAKEKVAEAQKKKRYNPDSENSLGI